MTLRQRLRVSIVQIAERKNLFQVSWHWLHENGRIDMRRSSAMVWINQALTQSEGPPRLGVDGGQSATGSWPLGRLGHPRASHQISAKGRTLRQKTTMRSAVGARGARLRPQSPPAE
jgi:hypothetical protein